MTLRPEPAEYAPFYAGYVSLVPEGDLLELLGQQPGVLRRVAAKVSPDGESRKYGPEKWSVREVFGHLGDAERAFAYRLFCISRGESAPLPGFDEIAYVTHSRFDSTPLGELVDEVTDLRSSSLAMIRRLGPDDWSRAGNANGSLVTVRALAFILAGHVLHHLAVLQARYGLGESRSADA